MMVLMPAMLRAGNWVRGRCEGVLERDSTENLESRCGRKRRWRVGRRMLRCEVACCVAMRLGSLRAGTPELGVKVVVALSFVTPELP